jgi:hypothetical protein
MGRLSPDDSPAACPGSSASTIDNASAGTAAVFPPPQEKAKTAKNMMTAGISPPIGLLLRLILFKIDRESGLLCGKKIFLLTPTV